MGTRTRTGRSQAALTGRLERLSREQESLRAVVESISAELELRPLLTRILRAACRLIGATDGAIGLVDEERGLARTEAVYRMPRSELGAEMPPGVGAAGQVLLTGCPVLLRRYGDLPCPTQLGMLENAVLCVPITARGRIIGFFGLGISAAPRPARRAGRGAAPAAPRRPRRSRKAHFTHADVRTLSAFAEHAAVAIQNARRYEWERRRTERLALIARVGRIITADLRLDDMLQRAADAIHELLGYPSVAIPLIEPADPDTMVLTTFGGSYKHLAGREYRIPTAQGLMGAASRTRQAVLVNDVLADPRYLPTPFVPNPVAELAVPIVIGDRTLGVVNVESERPFSDDDAALLRIVADQLAVAIENARLYAAAQRIAALEERQRLARELHDSVTQLVFGVALLAESLGSTWRRDAAEGERRTERLVVLSREALMEMRALLAELRPATIAQPVVERGAAGLAADPEAGDVPASDGNRALGVAAVRTHGLPGALAQHARIAGLAAGEGLHIELDTRAYVPQGAACEEALYRIAQEALNNVVKHADARRVRVKLAAGGADVQLTVEDDGAGFPDPGYTPHVGGHTVEGLGLATMHERALEIGGAMRVVTARGRGTAVHVTVPASRSAAAPPSARDSLPAASAAYGGVPLGELPPVEAPAAGLGSSALPASTLRRP